MTDTPYTAAPLPGSERLRLLSHAGLLLLLLSLAAPWAGLISIPVAFFLKNRLHLSANEVAQFNLWVSIPLYLSFALGLVRDRWNPFGAGDRGHLVLFGLATAAVFAIIAVLQPSYAVLMGGLLVATSTVLVAMSAATGIFSAMGQKHLMPGQASAVMLIASWAPLMLGSVLGGVLSQTLEMMNGANAARALFLVGIVLLGVTAALAATGPRALFTAHAGARRQSLRGDIGRLLRHWPVYPVTLLLLIWNFQPAFGTAVIYFLSNHLHASDAEVGAFFGVFWGAQMLAVLLYGRLCQSIRLSRLLWVGTIIGAPAILAMLLATTPTTAIIAAGFYGLMTGIGTGAYTDLAVRSSPRGLEGTMMMLILNTTFYVSGRFGDLWGTYVYDRAGGFPMTVIVSVVVYLSLPLVLLIVPRRLTSTSDGEAAA